MVDRLEILNRLYQGLKFKDAEYHEKTNTCVINFLYNPESFTPSEEKNAEIKQKLEDIVGNYVGYSLNFVKCPLDKHAIANHTYTAITNNFPAISQNFTFDDITVNIENMKVELILNLTPTAYDYAYGNREQFIADKLKESFLADFEIKFTKKEGSVASTDIIKNNAELMSSIKVAEEKTVYEIKDIANIIGNNDYSLAIDYSKINSPLENVVICGEVTNCERRTYKRNVTKNGESKEVERTFYSFAIKNENKVLYCSIFPRQADETKGDLIEVGMKVSCFGSFREFNGKLNFTANTIARCNYKREEIKSALKPVNESYHTVFPEKYIDYEQSGLFDEEKHFDGTFVVFDLETTGLESIRDEIIEIGACKIVDGRIDEVFSTFVNPNRHIPKEITALTGIDDSMVANAPTINYVLPDFYKFCYGSTMVGHNVSFDIGFIYAAGKKLSYNFDNPLKDTMEMARQKLPGLKNYKLGTVVERLNVVLDNAHRAINDATATAKVFIKLM